MIEKTSNPSPSKPPSHRTQEETSPIRQFLNNHISKSPLMLFSALGLLIFLLAVRGTVEELFKPENQQEFLIIFILSMYFPVTYIAYQWMNSEKRIKRLEEEVKFLGYPEDNIEQLQADVTDQYKKTHSPFSYTLLISLTVLLTIFGLSTLFWQPNQLSENGQLVLGLPIKGLSISLNINTLQAMRYGFLGAYIFSAYLLYRRYSTNDLHPTVYLYCSFTLIAGLAFNYVAFEAMANLAASTNATQNADGIGAGLIAILAFSIGYFPYLAVRWFNRLAYSAFQVGERRADSQPLSMIDGISDWHETRLRDNGIDDVQNLASAEIIDLLINTSFTTQQIVSWIDQAILYQYLDQAEIDSFRRGKINIFTDFMKQIESINGTLIPEAEITALATSLQTTKEKLVHLRSSIKYGPNTHRVNKYWELADEEATKIKYSPPKPAEGSATIEVKTEPAENPQEPDKNIRVDPKMWASPPKEDAAIPPDYFFLNHTSFLRKDKQAEFQKITNVYRDHYDIRVIVDSYYGGALDRIDYVEYILHQSYPNPRRRHDNRKDNFMLKELANGQFVLMAQVFLKDRKEPVLLQRFITLWETGPRFQESKKAAAA